MTRVARPGTWQTSTPCPVESALADDIVWYRGDAQTAETAAAEIFARDYPDFAT